jgi:hypothetical protein
MLVLLGICPPTSAQVRSSRDSAESPSAFGTAAKNATTQPAAVSGEDTETAALTLRPASGMELLASRVVRVLALKFGQGSIRVGGPPPPGLLEAVPAGHLALARDGDRVRLVLGAAFGAFFEASVPLAKPASVPDVRSLALAVEALRDRVIEAAERTNQAHHAGASAHSQPQAQPEPQPAAAGARSTVRAGPATRDRGEITLPRGEGEVPRAVQPMFYVRMYTGASLESDGPKMGFGTGGGLCVEGHCLVIGLESPFPGVLEAGPTDVRYRYPTITSSFYTRPWQFGIFAPAASVGFLSRIGYFNRDMGVPTESTGLDTDLGVRTTLEGAIALGGAFELTSEFGMDYALDRWQLGTGSTVARRGDRATLWTQAGIRVRPY